MTSNRKAAGWKASREQHALTLVLLTAALLSAPLAWAQEPPATPPPALEAQPAPVSPEEIPPPAPAARPKIGLALSGGGARGAAHIGVLKELERQHIPVDYIAGTSMGSIVGGLYASGMTPDEIQNVLLTADWGAIFTDRPPRKDLSFRRKEDDHRYITSLDLGVNMKGLKVGKGLIVGQHLNSFLESLTLKVSQVDDFDRFPIPFRCVAADIVTGERVVFSKGRLSQAIRASMSMPGIFEPVRADGRLLVDGGILDNLPVDVVRDMGADIVIAVDIGTPPKTEEQLKNFLAITGQVLSILMQKSTQEQAKKADILIRPDLKGFSNMNFPMAGTLIPIGFEAAEAKAEVLGKYAIPEAEFAARLAKIQSLPQPPATLDFVRFEGTDPKTEAFIRKQLLTKPGAKFDEHKVAKDLDHVYAAGQFQSVNYRLETENGKTGLVIHAVPDPLGPNFVRFGLQISIDFKNQNTLGLLAGLRVTRINALGAEWKTDLMIGINRRLYTEFYQPLDRRARWFVAPVLEYNNLRENIYIGAVSSEGATYRNMYSKIGFDLGFNFGTYGELRIGTRWGNTRFNKIIGPDYYPDVSGKVAGYQMKLTLDRLDSVDFPTQGSFFRLAGYQSEMGLGADDSYRKAELVWKAYGTKGRNTFTFGIQGGSALGSELPPYDYFLLGGFSSFAGYEQGSLIGQYYGVTRLGYSYRMGNLPPMLGQGFYLYVFADVGNVWQTTKAIEWSDLRYSGTVAVGTATKFGPMYIGYSRTKEGSNVVSLFIGKYF